MIAKFRSSLRLKIGALLLLLSLVPLVIVGAIVLSSTFTQLGSFSTRLNDAENTLRSDVVGRNLTGAAADTAADIDGYLLERIADVRRWSEESVVIEAARQGTLAAQQQGLVGLPPDELQTKLQGQLFVPITQTVFSPALSYIFFQTERPETPFVEIIVTEASGINVLVTRPVERLTHTDEDWWQAAHDQGIAGIGLTAVQLNPTTNLPVVGIALPIIDPNSKKVLGVIRGLVKLTELQHRMSQKAASVEADIRVFTADGRLIADTASTHNAALILTDAGNMVKQDYAPALKALETKPGANGAGSMLIDTKQGREIVGYARTSGSDFYDLPAQLSGFAGFGWGVTVAQPESRAMQVLAQLIETGREFEQLPSLLGGLFGAAMLLVGVLSLIGMIVVWQTVIHPIASLGELAQKITGGGMTPEDFEPEELAKVATRTDELGHAAQLFLKMAREVYEREKRLAEQVQQLRIEIDEAKRQREVSEIVDSDFFQDLQKKAGKIRRRGRSSSE